MPARHILSYARDLSGGGVERALLRLAGGWVAAGRRVTLVLGRADGPLAVELPAGVAVIELGATGKRKLARGLIAAARADRPDILFCPGNHYTGMAAWARWRLGGDCPPLVGKMSNAVSRGDHGWLLDRAHHVWLGWHGRFLDHLVGMTPATAVEAAAATGMIGRVSAIPNPPAMPLPDAVRPPLPGGRFVLGVGRLVRQKRWDRLVAALPALDVPVVILGEGAERATLAAQAAALGVADRLHLPGHAADPLPAMARAAVLALPSDFEGVPGVLREALSVGTPVVTTDSSPAVHEIVASPALGTVVGREDAGALAAALRGWLNSGARPAPVPLPGRDSAERYLALFDRLVDQTSPTCGRGTSSPLLPLRAPLERDLGHRHE